jgi:hypothetical protein
MGREIRRVPAGWEHPVHDRCQHHQTCARCFVPLYDRDYQTVADEWLKGVAAWEADEGGKRSRVMREHGIRYFWDWYGGPPDKDSYRPAWTDAERTHVQMYETVSEGTPVTPPFATREELVEYLVAHGDFWDQLRSKGGWRRENAERFVASGYAPSFMVRVGEAGADIRAPRDGQP